MFRQTGLGVLAIVGSMFGAPSHAEPFSGEATLATPVATPSENVIDGITWKCEDTRCVGRSPRASKDSQMRECIKLVLAVGPVTAFRSGRRMSGKAVEECNESAKQLSQPRSVAALRSTTGRPKHSLLPTADRRLPAAAPPIANDIRRAVT